MRYALSLVMVVTASVLFLALNGVGKTSTTQARVSMENLPDLVVTDMRLQYEGGDACNWPGMPLGTRVWVQNIGDGDAGPFVVELSGDVWAQQTLSSGLAAGHVASLWFLEYYPGLVTATADATFVVTESNEDNNTLFLPLPLPTPPATCTPVAAPTETPTPTPADPVGGMAEYPSLEARPAAGSDPWPGAVALAGAAAGGALLLAASVIWAARRSRPS